MFNSVGTLLSPLFPLLNLFAATGDDETDEQDQTLSGDSDEQGDNSDGEKNDDEDDDDLFNDLDDEERTRRNADSLISQKDDQLVSSLTSMVRSMAKHPDAAEEMLNDLREEQPKLAQRLAKMYDEQKDTTLSKALEDAPDSVRGLLSKLVSEVGTLKRETSKDRARDEKRAYKEWESTTHPYLSPKSNEGKTEAGKKLRSEFREALNRLPENEPVTEDLLEDALVIAKRRSGWDNSRVSDQVKQQAKEQAQKARSGAVGTGKGKKESSTNSGTAPSRVTSLWPNQSDDRQKKVDEVKKKRNL